MSEQQSTFQKIYHMVRNIPRGRVATYGQIAVLANLPRQARMVGYALHACPDDLPWHRVINAKGEISRLPDPDSRTMQQRLLEQEGVVFRSPGKLDLKRYQWNPERES